ncbi:PIG-L deacetylase family protein [Sporomusa aerivorans]|uniref:PIG-L deacetylase family protein n=1 Tax=Sporomusa aerivorans TaxID=204936 RepID=UPI003529EFF6
MLICLGLVCFGIYKAYFYYQEKPETRELLPAISIVPGKARLLIIAPHCDDETLGCAGVIQEVVSGGGQVMIVAMTNGDGFTFAVEEQYRQLILTSDDYVHSGYTRQKEFIQALDRLGVVQRQLAFLGYPDRGLRALWAEHWYSSQPYQSPYTGRDHSPYENSFRANTPYAGEAVINDLETIMREFAPSVIFSPHPVDEHPDHAATWAFVSAAAYKVFNSGELPKPKIYTYLIHRGDFPIPHGYQPEGLLLPPKPLYYNYNSQWQAYTLTAEQEAVKEQALNEYVSQLRVPVMSSLLRSFIRKNELFEEAIPHIALSESKNIELANLNAWENRKPALVYPVGTSALGALERSAKVEAIDCAVQDNVLWLRFHIPGFSTQHHQYQIAVIGFQAGHDALKRDNRSLSFSAQDTDLLPAAVYKFKEDVIINIPYSEQTLPEFFLIQTATKDRFGATIDRTAWQQVQINKAGPEESTGRSKNDSGAAFVNTAF